LDESQSRSQDDDRHRIRGRPVVMDEAAVRIVAFLPWGPGADSLPESMVPGPVTSTQLTPAPDMRAVVKVRSLPGGVPQLLMPVTRGARVRRLGTQPVSLDVESTGEILDAVVSHDGGAVLLERVDGVVALRATDQEGTPSWRTTDVSKKATRLLTNDRGDVFVSGKGFLSQINASGDTGPVTLEWDGGEAVMRPDGRLGFVRYVADRLARDWVELDPGTGACTTVEGSAETWALLGRVIGVDGVTEVRGDHAVQGSGTRRSAHRRRAQGVDRIHRDLARRSGCRRWSRSVQERAGRQRNDVVPRRPRTACAKRGIG
jgi:hypothetical protein